MKSDLQIVSLQLDKITVERLKTLAVSDGRTLSSLLRVIINNYLEKDNEERI